jgi:hypothetical protein
LFACASRHHNPLIRKRQARALPDRIERSAQRDLPRVDPLHAAMERVLVYNCSWSK